MLVYDVARPYTFEACRAWLGRINEAVQPSRRLPGVLVANKSDLTERMLVRREDGQALAQELGLMARASTPCPLPSRPRTHRPACLSEGAACVAACAVLGDLGQGGQRRRRALQADRRRHQEEL